MIRCPRCNNANDFALDAVEYVTAYVFQHRTDGEWFLTGDLELEDTASVSRTEWEDNTSCRCLGCGYTAPLDTLEVSNYLWCVDASVS